MAKGAGIMEGIPMLILSVGGIILMLFFVTYSSQRHNLNSIKDKTVGNGWTYAVPKAESLYNPLVPVIDKK